LREEIDKKTRRRERTQSWLLLIFGTVGWLYLLASVLP